MPKKRKNVIKFDMTISALPLSAEDLTALRFAGFYYISELQAVSIDSLMFSDARKERIKEALQKHVTGEDLELDDVDEDNFDDFDFDDDTMDELLLDDADFDLSLEDDIEDLGTDDNESDEKRKHASSQTTKEAAKSSSAVEESFISAAATPIANNKTQLTKSVLERDNKRSVPTRSISYKKEKEKTADSIFDDNIDPQAPVFPDFKVVDNQIIHIPSKLILKDSAIEAFLFSARPYNCLKRVGIDTVQGIVPLTIEELLGIRNLGKKSAGEIYEKIKKYLVHQIERNGLSYDEPEPEPEKEQQLSFNGPISIVPHADNHPRLGSEYAVIDSIIVNRFNSTGVNDAPISELALSTRSYNGLFRNKIYRVSQLIGMLIDDLFAMKNLGKKSADEIFEKLNKYLMLHSLPINGGVAQIDGDDEKETPSIIQIEYTHDSVMSVFIGHEIEILSKKQIIDALPNSKVDIDALIEELLEQKKIEREGDGYQLVLPTFDEMLNSGELPLTPRETKILLLRSAGFRLEEVGVHFNCTRERIRQIEAKALRKMKKVYCAEDRHSYLFQTYRITKKEWKEIFNSSGVDYYYLQGKYKKGNAELEKAIDDLLLSTTEKRIIQNKLHKGLLRVGDRYIPLTRHDIEDYVLREYCREECTIDQFIDIYNSFVMEHTDDNNLLIDTEGERYREVRLSASKAVLWKQNRRLRYYDIAGRDFSELLDTLNLGQFHNVELSTLKFIRQFPELMEQYDIRDEYELHNILRKISAEKENPELTFTRMPGLMFGVFDRDAAVRAALFENAPVSIEKLAVILSNEYGIKEETIRANWFSCIAEYYHQGVYSVDYRPMPEQHLQALKAALTEDFYTIEEIKRIYTELIQGADSSLVSSFNLKRMGFVVNSTYVIQHYSSAEDYFTYLLTAADIVDAKDINQRYSMLSAYSSTLMLLKDNRTIIEFEPFQYINIRRLEKLGIPKERLDRYCDEVATWLTEERYFSIKSIHNAGFESTLDDLGFSDMFYNSLLREDSRFTYQRIGNQVVFSSKKERFSRRDFIVWLVQEEESIDIDDFVTLLFERFGVVQDKGIVKELVKDTDIYFDSIMNKLYANYDLYYEEI